MLKLIKGFFFGTHETAIASFDPKKENDYLRNVISRLHSENKMLKLKLKHLTK
ncbi:MAG: hypothetical protein WC401_10250 [Bacteroidales bacterium]|jgi:hypothetical protein